MDVNLVQTIFLSVADRQGLWGCDESTTDLALGKEELDAAAGLGMGNGVVLALFIVAHGVEAV